MGTMIAPDQLFDRPARLVPVPAVVLQGLALLSWLAAAGAIAFGHPVPGAGLILAAWFLDGLSMARAREEGRADQLHAPLGMLVIPFGFAIADPGRALAGMFLLLALTVWLTQGRSFVRSWFGVVTTLGYGAAAILPYYFSPLAYLIGIVAFVLAGQGSRRR